MTMTLPVPGKNPLEYHLKPIEEGPWVLWHLPRALSQANH